MATMLDLGPAVTLQGVVSRAAFFTSLTVYLEGIAAAVLLTEASLRPAAIVPLVLLAVAQVCLIRGPVRSLVRGRLVRVYRLHLGLALLYVVVLGLGVSPGEGRAVAVVLGALVVAGTSWPCVAAMTAARRLEPRFAAIADPAVVVRCLSFDPRESLMARWRGFGGDRFRFLAPLSAFGLALAATALGLALLLRLAGVDTGGAAVAQIATVVALWVFYRSLRHAKLSGSQLRKRDTRPPIVVLRRFEDDALGSGPWHAGGGPTFEHVFAAELNRIGPAIAVGRPGERLQPLGAAREYLVDADWRRAVGSMIDDAAFVVLVLGDSESLVWEFTTTVAARGSAQVLIIVPPVSDPQEAGRRWERFREAAGGALGPRAPRRLPDTRALAVWLPDGDTVLMVCTEPVRRRWSPGARKWPDYRLALRLFDCLRREEVGSIGHLETFLQTQFPIVRLSPHTEPATDAPQTG